MEHTSASQYGFPFIVGCGRSGTTLLRAMLDSHPDLAVVYESYFIPGLLRTRSDFEREAGFDTTTFVSRLVTHFGYRSVGIPREDLESQLRELAPTSTADAIRDVYAIYARSHGKSRYADKTPLYVLNLPEIIRHFPEARIVHMIRDGRSVALAYLDNEWGPQTLEEAAVYWRRHVRAGRRMGARLGPERYTEVRYERLVEDPEGTLRTLCGFLDLGFDPRMLDYTTRSEVPHLKTSRQHDSLRMAPTPGLRDWRSRMTEQEAGVFETIAGAELKNLGYPVETRSTPLTRARAARHIAQVEGQRTWKRITDRIRLLRRGDLRR